MQIRLFLLYPNKKFRISKQKKNGAMFAKSKLDISAGALPKTELNSYNNLLS
jgi:hypothetical protein